MRGPLSTDQGHDDYPTDDRMETRTGGVVGGGRGCIV